MSTALADFQPVQFQPVTTPPLTLVGSEELPEPHDDLEIGDAVLDGLTVRAQLADATIDSVLERTIDGASTLTLSVEDPKRVIIRNHVISQKFRHDQDVLLTLDGRDFSLVKISKQGDRHDLVFENRLVNEMRHVKGALRSFRDAMTRAEFILRMVRQVQGYNIKFYSPELHKVQEIATKVSRNSQSARQRLRHSGIASNANLDFQNVKANKTQISNANRALDVAYTRKGGTPFPVVIALMEALIDESDVKNLPGGDRDSAGILQQRPSQGWGTYSQVRDIERAVRTFLNRAVPIYTRNPRLKPHEIAQAVQRSGTASGSNYSRYHSEAVAAVAAYGGHGGSGSISFAKIKRYPFKRGQNEDSWTAAKRLADQVGWLLFAVDDTLYYISWEALLASAARMTVTEATPGVSDIDFDVDKGKQVETVTITCRANRWSAPPGTVVILEEMGAANGRWVVGNHRRPLSSHDAEIQLQRPGKSKKEPAAAVQSVSLRGSASTLGTKEVTKAYNKAVAIWKRHLPYTWGGGHGSFNPSPGYDCSGYVSACLHAAGWLSHPEATGELSHWGKPGVGRYLTVWVKSTGAAHIDHTFMEFHLPGQRLKHFGTGRWGTSASGPGYKPQLHTHAGFSPRHWPGN